MEFSGWRKGWGRVVINIEFFIIYDLMKKNIFLLLEVMNFVGEILREEGESVGRYLFFLEVDLF